MMNQVPIIGISGSINKEETEQFLNRDYLIALTQCGAIPVILSLDMGDEMLSACLDGLDGLLLGGGNDPAPNLFGHLPVDALGDVSPLRDRFEMSLIKEAARRKMPTLGVCRGEQMMNVALGGTLYQDLPSQYVGERHKHVQTYGAQYASHAVTISPGTLLHRIEGMEEMDVNSFHHQAVWEVAPEMVACAIAKDGVVEAIEHRTLPFFLGVQWHPERMHRCDRQAMSLFEALTTAARDYGKGGII